MKRKLILERLKKIRSPTPVVVWYATMPGRMRKKGNRFFGDVLEVGRVEGTLCKPFEPTADKTHTVYRPWGVRLGESPLIEHLDETYVEVSLGKHEVIYQHIRGGRPYLGDELKELEMFLDPKEGKPVKTIRTSILTAIKLAEEPKMSIE